MINNSDPVRGDTPPWPVLADPYLEFRPARPELPVSAATVRKSNRLPDGPREYHQLLRRPGYRWWRPLLAMVLVGAFAVSFTLLAFIPVVLIGVAVGVDNPMAWAVNESLKVNDLGPAGFLYSNLSLIVLIPAAGLSIWIAHRVRPRFLSSVNGGIRWRWMLRCLVVVVPVWALYLGLDAFGAAPAGLRPAHWILLLFMVVFLTPLQAAGEEYFFRGWIMQNVGSLFRRPLVGLVVSLTISVVTFSAAHGSPDIWVLADLGAFALTAGILTWRTGGLEAAIVIHAVNNIGVFFVLLSSGGWDHAFVGADTKSSPLAAALSIAAHLVALVLILWQARRAGIQRRYLPPESADPEIRRTGGAISP
jgi:membrane protease YdiL (CAAX protease family)